MATVRGVLLGRETGRIALATATDVLSLSTADDPVPASIRAGDEVAGWRQGALVREIRLARIRTDAGLVEPGPGGDGIRLDTGQRVWELRVPDWPEPFSGAMRLRVCHDGHLALWMADGDGEVWLPPARRDCDDCVKRPGLLRHTAVTRAR